MPTLPSSRGTNSSLRLVSVLVRCRATARLRNGSLDDRFSGHPSPPTGLRERLRHTCGWTGRLLLGAREQADGQGGDALATPDEAESLRGLGDHLEARRLQVER